MREWFRKRKAKMVGGIVAALVLAILTGALKLPPAVATPVANALGQVAENMIDGGALEQPATDAPVVHDDGN